jgi:hypothetical protein
VLRCGAVCCGVQYGTSLLKLCCGICCGVQYDTALLASLLVLVLQVRGRYQGSNILRHPALSCIVVSQLRRLRMIGPGASLLQSCRVLMPVYADMVVSSHGSVGVTKHQVLSSCIVVVVIRYLHGSDGCSELSASAISLSTTLTHKPSY